MKKILLLIVTLSSISTYSNALEYYNTKADLGLQNLGTWSSTPDGTGSSPLSFADANQTFYISDQAKAHYSGNWAVSGFNSKVVVGTAASPVTFTILPGADYISSTTSITVSGNSTLIIKNNIIPQFSAGYSSTIDFAQTGTSGSDTIKIPATTYWNLKLTGGIKYFQSGTTTVSNEMIADGVVNIGAFPTSVSPTVFLCQGNMTFLNGTHFDSSASEDSHRISLLKFSSLINGQPQQINTNGTDLVVQQVRIEGTGPVIFSPNTNILLRSVFSNGIVFTQAGSSLVTSGGLITFMNSNSLFNINYFGNQVGIINSNGTSFKFICSPPPLSPYTTPGCIGRLVFTPNSTIGDLTMNTSAVTDSIQILSNVKITGALNMIKGKITLADNVKLELGETATTPQPGNINSFIYGEIISTGTNARTIPIGNYKYNKFAPVDFTNHTSGNSYSFTYFPYTYPDNSIASSTLAVFPGYNVGRQEYWNITTTNPGNADAGFHYNDAASGVLDPSALHVAVYNNGSGWTDLGGIPDPGNTLTSGSVQVTNLSSFGPFTFAGTGPGTIPVKLISFSARKQNSSVQLLWSTAQETNSRSFIIQRSRDEISWTNLITIPAAGNSTVRKDYAAADYTPFSGFNYYRLKTVDMDNRSDISAVKAVSFTNNSVIVMNQDLPGTAISIYIPQENLPAAVGIYDAGGKLVGRYSATEPLSGINVSLYAKGIYILKIDGQHLQESKKIVIN